MNNDKTRLIWVILIPGEWELWSTYNVLEILVNRHVYASGLTCLSWRREMPLAHKLIFLYGIVQAANTCTRTELFRAIIPPVIKIVLINETVHVVRTMLRNRNWNWNYTSGTLTWKMWDKIRMQSKLNALYQMDRKRNWSWNLKVTYWIYVYRFQFYFSQNRSV